MKAWLHEKVAAVFWITLSLYVSLPAFGVNLGADAHAAIGPLLLVSGLLAWLTALGGEG